MKEHRSLIRDILGQSIAEELVTEAYAQIPEFFPQSPLKKSVSSRLGGNVVYMEKSNFFSKVECACGCTTLTPTHLVERGWKYIRGHKPRQPLKVSVESQKIHEKAATVLSEKSIIGFFESRVSLLTAQLTQKKSEREAINAAVVDLELQLHRNAVVLKGLKSLGGEANAAEN